MNAPGENECERFSAVESHRNDETIGLRLGPFRIESEIGRGGMGAVYRASRQAGGFQQRVAVKILKRGMDSAEIIRRFERERSILARLTHPRVAKLLDGGIAPDGRPWFAMELVAGQPITAACDARRLDVDARLAVFLDVCDAVRFAHRNLVVHRDIKPSNVLAGDEGGAFTVKLLDFGIAKLVADDPDGKTTTRSELRLLTPDYAAPEQTRGEPITTATDIYALGLLLHELLTGVRSNAAAPSRPSAAVLTEPGAAERAGARGTTRGALRRRLQGDLDRIVAMATELDPARRYGSVEALAEDLRRHRAGLPVLAQNASLGYVATKFLRRHRLAASAAALLVLALAAGLATTLWQARKATREARVNARVQQFLFDLFNDANPDVAKRADVTARDLLARATERFESDFAEEPKIRASLYRVIVELHEQLGMFKEAVPLGEKSLAIHRAAFPAKSLEIERALVLLGQALRSENQDVAAETALREALALCEERSGRRSAETAEIQGQLGSALIGQRRFDEGLSAQREAVAIAREADAGKPTDILASRLYSLGVALFEADRFDEADAVNRELLETVRAFEGAESTRVAAGLQVLGMLQKSRGALGDARKNLEASLAMYMKLVGERHPDVGHTLGVLANILASQGESVEAREMFERSLSILKKSRGVEHEEVLGYTVDLATVLHDLSDDSEATKILSDALANAGPSLPRTNQFVLRAKSTLAALLPDTERAEALRLKREVLATTREVFGVDSSAAAWDEASLAVDLHRDGDVDEVKSLLVHAAGVFETASAPQQASIAYAREGLGYLALEQKDWAGAEAHFRLAIAARTKSEEHAPLNIADGRIGLARALTNQSRIVEALPYFDAALEDYAKALGADADETRHLKEEIDRTRAKLAAAVDSGN